jgi:hypothetical protein
MRIGRTLSCICLLALLATGAMAQQVPEPARIGELELTSIATPHPYPAAWGADAQSWTVRYPQATYIRVHFSDFDLAPGDYVQISNPSGSESYTFRELGPHGNGNFWASTIVGDTAVITLYAPNGGGYGFEIDSFGRGTQDFLEPIDTPTDPNEPDSVCGANNWRDVECDRNSHPNQFEAARAAVRLVIGCCTGCSGWKTSDSGQFFTNNHCTNSQSGVQSTECRMEYQNNACGGGGNSTSGSVFGSQLLRTDYTLDYTLFTTTGDSSGIPCLNLSQSHAQNGDRIFIAHHPSGGVKKMSIEDDQSATGWCKVDDNTHTGRAAASDIGYFCDTTNGSSGSPVLDYNTLEVIAAHHFGGCLNSGGRSDLIYPQVSGLLDTCSGPGGDPPVCGDGTCNGSEDECSCPSDCGAPPSSEAGSCTDGVDNDCDGQIDCGDSDCSSDPACGVCLPKAASCTDDSECCSNKCRGKRGRKDCK